MKSKRFASCQVSRVGLFAALSILLIAQPPLAFAKKHDEVAIGDYSAAFKAPGKSIVSRISSLPLSAAGVMTGIAVGVPVAIAKGAKKHSKSMKRSMDDALAVEGMDFVGHAAASGCALTFGLPAGVVCGSLEGVRRGIDAGSRRPFSKESMSLGRDIDYSWGSTPGRTY